MTGTEMRKIWLVLLALVPTQALAATETPYSFVSTYLHSAASMEYYRNEAHEHLSADPQDFARCIHDMEAWRLEIVASAHILDQMTLPITNQARDTPHLLAATLKNKAQSVDQLGNICAKFLTPQENVDYAALAATAPKIRAQIEAIDKSLFQGSILVFMSLISNKPDANNHMSFLSITAAQRDALLQQIQSDFGKQIAMPGHSIAVESAMLIRDKLREYHVADERPR